MAGIILPYRRNSQPQSPVSLSPNYGNAEILSLFNDGSGRDLAKGNHLIPGVTPTPVVRQQGKTLSFNGSNQYLVSTRTITPGAAFTVFAWVRPAALNTAYVRIVETAYDTGFFLGSNGASQYAWIINNASLEGCVGGQQVVGGRDFVCGTFDGTNRILYVNGFQVGSASATAPSTALTVSVGRYSGGAGYWNGDIDTVGVFNRAFPAPEVLSIYKDPWRLIRGVQPKLRITPGAPPPPSAANFRSTLSVYGSRTGSRQAMR